MEHVHWSNDKVQQNCIMPKRKCEKWGVPEKFKRLKIWNSETKRWVWQKVSRSAEETVEVEESGVTEPTYGEGQPRTDTNTSLQRAPKKTYAEKKTERATHWEKLHPQLVSVRTEMFGPDRLTCCDCSSRVERIIRCQDCGSGAYFCVNHYKEYHRFSPFHRPEIWQGEVFLPFHLPTDELPVLMRNDHSGCGTSRRKVISAVNSNGMPCHLMVEFCNCESEPATLLRHNLWAASPQSPRVAFHINLMEWYRVLLLECRVPVKGFIDAIAAKLDKFQQLSASEVTQLYKTMITDACENYLHHKYNLDHLNHIDPTFDDGTACPACFETENPLYSFDANFGLVRKASSGSADWIPHHQGRYFIDQASVDEFVNNSDTSCEKGGKECSNFRAGNNVRSKSRTKKLDETGVFGAACRHEFPKMFMNLKHGERLSYPVFLLQNLQAAHPGQHIVVMYDIACLLASHMKKKHGPRAAEDVQFVLPIFHSFGHKMICQLEYGPRKQQGIGLTDGETLERLWSYLRRFSAMTKQMTAQRRVDILSTGLLHYAERLRKNLSTRLVQKHQKGKATRISSQKAVQTLSQGMSKQDILELRSKEKDSCQKKTVSDSWSWQEHYALLLFDYYKEITTVSTSLEPDGPRQIDRLHAKLAVTESQRGFQRWDEGSLIFKENLQAAVARKRQQLLEKVRTLAAERQFHLSQIPDSTGQALFKKINTVITSKTKGLKKALAEYNALADVPAPADSELPVSVTVEQVTSSEGLFRFFSSPSSALIAAEDLLERANEELALVSKECKSAHAYYEAKHAHLTSAMDNTTSGCSQISVGCRALITRHIWECEIRMKELELVSDYVCLTEEDKVSVHVKPILQALSSFKVYEPEDDLSLENITADDDCGDLMDDVSDSDSESEIEDDIF